MFRRWQHGDVLDAFVVGLAGAVCGAGFAYQVSAAVAVVLAFMVCSFYE
jgi:hypothetical protein